MEIIYKNHLMGGEIEFRSEGVDEILAKDLFEEIYERALKLEKVFNIYDPESEISLLNKKREINASADLKKVIKKALLICKETNGSYDISHGKIFLNRKKGIPEKKLNCSYRDILVKDNIISLKHPHVIVDLNSIAKGYIVDKLIELMKEKGLKKGYIDARGDISFFGMKEETIEIQHPRDKNKSIASFKCKNSSVATSGDYNQYIGEYNNSHIVGKKDLISATVISDNLMEADAIATALLVMSKKNRDNFLENYPKIKAALINKDLKINFHNWELIK
jgi:thiamine biosynthesis lipoprotein